MPKRSTALFLAASIFAAQCLPGRAFAENQMGYRLLTAQEATELPRRGGALGIAVAAAQRINESDLSFEVLQVTGVRRGSPGAAAGLKPGDMIVAADGRVFPSVAAFSAYAGSIQQGGLVSVDYIPAGHGPKDAQRVAVRFGAGPGTAATQTQTPEPQTRGLSSGTKVAIGIGAAALFGCYKFGCFSRKRAGSQTQSGSPGMQLR